MNRRKNINILISIVVVAMLAVSLLYYFDILYGNNPENISRDLSNQEKVDPAEKKQTTDNPENNNERTYSEAELSELIALLDSPDMAKRISEVEILGEKGNKGAIPELLRIFKSKDIKDVHLKLYAAGALCKLGNKSGFNFILDQLRNRDNFGYDYAVKCMFAIRDRSLLPELLKAFKDKSAEVRFVVAYVLGSFEDEKAVNALLGALDDKDVRWSIIEALRFKVKIVIPVLIKLMKEDKREIVDDFAFEALSSSVWDENAIPEFINALEDKDANVRFVSILVLSRFRDRAIAPKLEKILRDENINCRKLAVSALGTIGDKTAVPALIESLNEKDREFRISVLNSLSQLTKQDFRMDIPKWRKWWEANKDRLLDENAKRMGHVAPDDIEIKWDSGFNSPKDKSALAIFKGRFISKDTTDEMRLSEGDSGGYDMPVVDISILRNGKIVEKQSIESMMGYVEAVQIIDINADGIDEVFIKYKPSLGPGTGISISDGMCLSKINNKWKEIWNGTISRCDVSGNKSCSEEARVYLQKTKVNDVRPDIITQYTINQKDENSEKTKKRELIFKWSDKENHYNKMDN